MMGIYMVNILYRPTDCRITESDMIVHNVVCDYWCSYATYILDNQST